MNKIFTLFFTITVLLELEIQAQGFTNISSMQGTDVITLSSDSEGSGVSFFDFNNDGWDDLSFAMESDTQAIFLNNQGDFEVASIRIFNPGQTKMILWIDYDEDDDFDLFLTTKDGNIKLYNNNGAFIFTDVTISAGLSQNITKNIGASFGDYDRDGDLDLYVCKYIGYGDSLELQNVNNLYRNNGDGTFTDVTWYAGVSDGVSPSFQGIWVDYNYDGWPDLFVVNDRNNSTWQNGLYRNNGDGTFASVGDTAGVFMDGAYPMTGSFADFDNDNDLDLFVSSSAIFPTDQASFLVNQNDGTFIDEAVAYNLQVEKTGWGGLWLDYDNDLDQDLYVATDWLYSTPIQSRNHFMVNEYPLPFVDDSTLMMGLDTASSHAVARGDLNRDGFYDIVVHTDSPSKGQLWLNDGNNNNYIRVTLEGTVSNKMAIGSWIKVFVNGQQYTQYTFCGEMYMGQNSQHNIIGLGNATIVDSVHIEFLSGITNKYYNLNVNQTYHFVEGVNTGAFNIVNLGSSILCHGDTASLQAPNFSSYLWNTGDTTQSIAVTQTGDYSAEAYDSLGILYYSNVVHVEVAEELQISITSENVSCANFSDASIYLEILNEIFPYEITWNDGSIGDSLENLSVGTYTFTYLDSLACSYTDSVQISEPFPLNVQTLVTDETLDSSASILLLINGGVNPYQVFLDSLASSDQMIGLSAGGYLVEVIDENGCYWFEEIEILFQDTSISTNIVFLEDIEFSVYPIPFSDNFTLAFDAEVQKDILVTLYNITGKIIYEESIVSEVGHNIKRIEVGEHLGKVSYLLTLTSNGNRKTLAIIKE